MYIYVYPLYIYIYIYIYIVDKKGRRMSDYIQIYCKTPYRKNSMYAHPPSLKPRVESP